MLTQRYLFDLLHLCHVPCWVIIPHSQRQTVAEHTFRVMAITEYLCDTFGLDGQTAAGALRTAFHHDIDEARTGDIPSTAKPTPSVQHTDEERVVKLADLIERYTYIEQHGKMGKVASQAKKEVYNRLAEYVTLHFADHESRVKSLVDHIIHEGV